MTTDNVRMRETLLVMMKEQGDSPFSLCKKAGIAPPVLWRFLKGERQDLKHSTIEKLAHAYGVTTNQIRGQSEEGDVLSPEERELVTTARNISPDQRAAWIKIGKALSELKHDDALQGDSLQGEMFSGPIFTSEPAFNDEGVRDNRTTRAKAKSG